MLSEDFHPWLLEINSSPGMCPTCPEKVRLCSSVIEDSIRGLSLIFDECLTQRLVTCTINCINIKVK